MSEDLIMPGYARRMLPNGTAYHVVHYSADPEKDHEWAADTMRGIPPREWRREMELDEDVSDGIPYWENYVDSLHCVKKGRPIPVLEGSRYLGGWDCGTARMPAFACCQITPKSRQLQWLFEVVPQTPMAMRTFAPIVRRRLQALLPGVWGQVKHVGDATVTTLSGAEERSAQDVAREYGFNIQPVSNSVDLRERAVIDFLTDYCSQDGPSQNWVPRMVYSEEGCPVLVAGMRGKYCVQPKASGDVSGAGAEYGQPAKNFYSHVNDSHQYPCVYLHKVFFGSGARRGARRL